MKNSVKDNSNTLKKFLNDLKNFGNLLSTPENDSEEPVEENFAASGIDNATTTELLQSLADIENGKHIITVNTTVLKPRTKKIKPEQVNKIETLTNTKLNIQRIETINNYELEK